MKYSICHITSYEYGELVTLSPHLIRLRPRSDSHQILHSFELTISPEPQRSYSMVDLDGNTIVNVRFTKHLTRSLIIPTTSKIETTCTNPFDYLLDDWATKLPIDYPASLLARLSPYLNRSHSGLGWVDSGVMQLGQELAIAAHGNPIEFLTQLNQTIHQQCRYMFRETGDPLPPGITWSKREGSCRDYAMLFLEVCRSVGLAARFVSGYHEGDPANPDCHLHAWVEVYLPGAGWRGYDPTQGLAVDDRYVVLAASPFSQAAAPVTGGFIPASSAEMTYQLTIQALED